MKKHAKVSGTAMSMPAGIGIGIGSSVILTLIGSMAAAWMMDRQMIGEEALGYIALSILLVSSAFGAWLAVIKIQHRKLFVCMLCAAGYYLALIMCTALFFGGQYSGMGVTGFAVLASALSVGLLCIREKRSTSGRHMRKMNR